MMKIIIDVSQLAYQGTGVARYLAGLTWSLLEIETEHSFTFYAGALQQQSFFRQLAKTEPFNKAKWHIAPIPPKISGKLFNESSLPIDLVAGGGDIFHSSDWSQPVTRMKKVTTVHDIAFRFYPETIDPIVLSTQQKRLQRLIDQDVHIIADSESTKRDLMQEYGINSAKISVVYPGSDPRFGEVSQAEVAKVKAKYNLRGSYVLTVGTLEPRKNLKRAIEAFQAFRQTAPGKEFSLVLAGKVGWGKQVDKPPFVITPGYIDEADLPALYCGASLFLYPSLYEGFGFPVLEAMQCGVPVITSNISSLPEVVGKAGILVNPTDVGEIAIGLAQALQHKAQLAKEASIQAATFTWQKCARQTLEVYGKL